MLMWRANLDLEQFKMRAFVVVVGAATAASATAAAIAANVLGVQVNGHQRQLA